MALHEFSALECRHIRCIQLKPLTVFPLCLKPLVPVSLDPDRVVGADGDNRLRGFRGDTGMMVFSGGGPDDAMAEVRRFQTLIAAGERLYVAADAHVYAFVF